VTRAPGAGRAGCPGRVLRSATVAVALLALVGAGAGPASAAGPWSAPRTVGPVVPDGEGSSLTAEAGPSGGVLLRRFEVDGRGTTALLPRSAGTPVFRGAGLLLQDGKGVPVDYGDGTPTVALADGDQTVAIADQSFAADAPPLSYGVVGPSGRPVSIRPTRIAGLRRGPTVRAAGPHLAVSALLLDLGGLDAQVWLARGTSGAGGARLGIARPVTPRAEIDDHRMAIGPRGHVLVAWTVRHGDGSDSTDDVLARTVSPHGRLSPVRRIGRLAGDASLESVAVDARGRSAVAWSGPERATPTGAAPPSTFWIAQGRGGRPPTRGRVYLRGRTTASGTDEIRSGELAFAGPGPPVVAVLRGGLGTNAAEVGTAATAGTLRRLSPRGVEVETLRLAAAPDGTAAVAFSGNPDVPLESGAVWAARRAAGADAFGNADRLARGTGGQPAVAVTPDGGRILVAWIGSGAGRTTYVLEDRSPR
jgi:hypothetical protein